MHDPGTGTNRLAGRLRTELCALCNPSRVLSLCVLVLAATAAAAQTAEPTRPTSAGERVPAPPAATAPPDPLPAGTPPVAVVPLDKTLPGAALSVTGPMQALNGRAYLTGSGSITAGTSTADVVLPARGTLHVCASSTVKLAADASASAGEVPGLLIALDRGAVEMSFGPSTAREKNADTLLTPYFHILIGGPNPADVKVRLGEHGDTCVDNGGANAPYVVVTSPFESGLYRVQPGQRVMFEHGSLQSVVDREGEPCGCPPAAANANRNEFPLAESEGLTPGAQVPVMPAPPAGGANATATLSYNGAHGSMQAAPVAAAPAAPPAGTAPAPTTSASQAPATPKKPGLLTRVGRFFKRIFGAE